MRTNEMVQVMGTLIEVAFIYKIEVVDESVFVFFLGKNFVKFSISGQLFAYKKGLIKKIDNFVDYLHLPADQLKICEEEAQRKREELVTFLLHRKGMLRETLFKFEL